MSIIFESIKEYSKLSDTSIPDNALFIFGKDIDERGIKIIEHLAIDNSMKFVYENKIDSFLINGDLNNRIKFNRHFCKYISNISSIVLEGTTLGYSEILTILFKLNEMKISQKIIIFYAEPEEYTKNINKGVLSSDEYQLSEEFDDFKYVKPFIFKKPHDSIANENATLIALLGFEENRLGRVLEENDNDKKYNDFIYIIAVPGFKPGWENISLSKHYHLFENKNEIHYTPADNPYSTYQSLVKISDNLETDRIIVMPIGTKPCTIGTAIFLINQKEKGKNIATKYDFPLKSKSRTSGIGAIYRYTLYIE